MSGTDLVAKLENQPKSPCEGCEYWKYCKNNRVACKSYASYIRLEKNSNPWNERNPGFYLEEIESTTKHSQGNEDMIVKNAEYVFLRCTRCGDKMKLAKNKGNYWKEIEITELEVQSCLDLFFLEHSTCPANSIKIEFSEV